MAKEFVPGSVGVHDAAGLYQQAWDFYQYLLRAEAETDAMLEKSIKQVEVAREKRPDLLEQAEEIRDRVLEIAYRIREIRVQTLGVYVQTIGLVLGVVQSARDQVKDDAVALGLGQFDLDLARVWERYNKMYAPFYGLDKSDTIVMPDVRKWGTFAWGIFDVRIAGPVLLWKTISECRDNWVALSVPPCHGPDYLHAWILANQSGVMLESHAHALEAIADSVYDFFKLATKTIVQLIADTAAALVIAGLAVVKGVARGLGGFLPLILGVAVVYAAMNTEKLSRTVSRRTRKKNRF